MLLQAWDQKRLNCPQKNNVLGHSALRAGELYTCHHTQLHILCFISQKICNHTQLHILCSISQKICNHTQLQTLCSISQKNVLSHLNMCRYHAYNHTQLHILSHIAAHTMLHFTENCLLCSKFYDGGFKWWLVPLLILKFGSPASTILSCFAIGCQIEPIKNVSALRTTLCKINSHELHMDYCHAESGPILVSGNLSPYFNCNCKCTGRCYCLLGIAASRISTSAHG